MNRTRRMEIAKQTVEIVKRREYTSADGRPVEIASAVGDCLNATQLFSPAELKRFRDDVLASPAGAKTTVLEVVNETTLAGIARLLADGPGPVAALNFASAKNPGGGFLNGSQAQEESLARSSALYASLTQAWDYYEQHRASPSLLYSDAMILSPGCPVFRGDDGALLAKPYTVAFITSAAPNASAVAKTRPHELQAIPEVLRQRSEYVLALAAAHGCRRLVLGAWGCGVFGNDPAVVAGAFANHLQGAWARRFERVVFSVLDNSATLDTFQAFRAILAPEVEFPS